MKPIAYICSDFPKKFGIPRQSGLADTRARIVFEPEYRVKEAFRGLECFSHIWLIWNFSEVPQEEWNPTVRPPRLGGNVRMGVFASRSPFRPNSIGLSSVRLEKIETDTKDGPVLVVVGADLMDGTPIYDIKPYLPYTDCHPQAKGGFADHASRRLLTVRIPEKFAGMLSEEQRKVLCQLLAQDPRPSYQNDSQRIYTMEYAEWEIKFQVDQEHLSVCRMERRRNSEDACGSK